MNDNTWLERFYEKVILSRYSELFSNKEIHWIDHGKVGHDAWAHYFECDKKQYALLYEDFPGGSFLDDNLSHEVVKCGKETSIELRFSDQTNQIPNITGWFTLYGEKRESIIPRP